MKRDSFLIISVVVAIVVLSFITLPLIIVCFTSFNATTQTVFPPNGWSLRWYSNIVEVGIFTRPFQVSLALAILCVFLTLSIAMSATIALTRFNFPGRSAIEGIIMSPLIVPQVITGLALLLVYSSIRGLPFIYLLVLHVILTLPYAMRVLLASMSRVGDELEEAAVSLGASRLKAFFLVTLPQIRAGIFAATFFSFVISFDNFTATAFLVNREPTLPVAIYGYILSTSDPTVAAIATLMLIATTALVLLIDRSIGLQRVT
jgi:putative spermidine/putrescine transport system permease protein